MLEVDDRDLGLAENGDLRWPLVYVGVLTAVKTLAPCSMSFGRQQIRMRLANLTLAPPMDCLNLSNSPESSLGLTKVLIYGV